MFEAELELNTELFAEGVEKKSMRTGFGDGLAMAGEINDNVVALCADVTESTGLSVFKEFFPKRFVEIGVAEQNLAGVASGMAAMGKIPFAVSYAVFSPGRNWEQIRTTICYNNSPVKLVGSHAGVTVGPDGGSHQALEDIALARVLPNMIVISPCDAIEAANAALAAVEISSPVYIRLSREILPVITTEKTPFAIGEAQIFYDSTEEGEGAQVGIIATGNMVYRAMYAAESLRREGVSAKVMNLSTIKPLDEKALIDLALETKALVTVEDHQIAGGMGSAVAEFLASVYPVPIEFVGVKNEFGQSGKAEELIEHYEMGEKHIKEAALRVLQRKA